MSCMRCGYDDYDCVCGTEHEHNTMETIILSLRTQLATEKERADRAEGALESCNRARRAEAKKADRAEKLWEQEANKLLSLRSCTGCKRLKSVGQNFPMQCSECQRFYADYYEKGD